MKRMGKRNTFSLGLIKPGSHMSADVEPESTSQACRQQGCH